VFFSTNKQIIIHWIKRKLNQGWNFQYFDLFPDTDYCLGIHAHEGLKLKYRYIECKYLQNSRYVIAISSF
jgi:hypothetical protein